MRYAKPEVEEMGKGSELVQVILTILPWDFEPSTHLFTFIDLPWPLWVCSGQESDD